MCLCACMRVCCVFINECDQRNVQVWARKRRKKVIVITNKHINIQFGWCPAVEIVILLMCAIWIIKRLNHIFHSKFMLAHLWRLQIFVLHSCTVTIYSVISKKVSDLLHLQIIEFICGCFYCSVLSCNEIISTSVTFHYTLMPISL